MFVLIKIVIKVPSYGINVTAGPIEFNNGFWQSMDQHNCVYKNNYNYIRNILI